MVVDNIASNLLRIRKSKDLNMQELADKCNLSRAGYSKIEHGQSQPKTSTLIQLARSLDVDIKDLLAEAPRFTSLRFRTLKSLSARDRQIRDQIIYEVDRWLKDYNELEQLLMVPKGTLPAIQGGEPAESAALFRNALGLDRKEPIADIIGLLEKRGIKFLLDSFDLKSFFGFSVGEADGGPAIVVNVSPDITIERRIFTVAHELGHLLLHRDSFNQDEVEEIDRQEAEANEFAGYFLLPKEGFEQEWSDSQGLYWADAVLHIKRKFKVSYRAVLYRLSSEYGHDARELYLDFTRYMDRKYGVSLKGHYEPQFLAEEKQEPETLSTFDFVEDKLHKLVREAYEQQKISFSRAAEILKLSLEKMRELNNGWKEYS